MTVAARAETETTSQDIAPATIVVGIDGEDGGREALALACRFAASSGGRIVAVCAYPALAARHALLIWPRISSRAEAAQALAGAREQLADRPRSRFACVAGTTPGSVLQRVAAEHGADLVVIGSSRRAAIGQLLGGDVVGQVLSHPTCAVAVALRGALDAEAPLAHVGIAVDGTDQALRAVRWAGALTQPPFQARKLELIHVGADDTQPVVAGHAVVEHLADEHRFEAYAALGLVGRLGTSVLVTWTEAGGAVVPALAELEQRLDLLVLGTHGRGAFGRLLHGAVAREVADCARCPVVVVPAALEDGQDEQGEHADGDEHDHGSGRH
ncbi:MAG: hypothetical protein QOI73_2248 [Solirubrobacteraceae bacterium]|nr:hypothetical protein [Solirubrobacteraceae bacterium]